MRTAAVTLLLLLATPLLAVADDKDKEKDKDKKEPEVEFNEKLQAELMDLVKEAEEMRKEVLKDPKKPDLELLRKVQAQDRKNTARLKEITTKYGWPTRKLIGDMGVNAAFALVQQADHDREYQRRCLKMMEDLAKKGELEKSYIAAMTDHMLVINRQRQRYGTQYQFNAKGELVPHAIEDEANVDKRREEMGLPKLADDLKRVRAQYKKP